MIVSKKEHVYFLVEEGNQYRVNKKGGSKNEGKLRDSNSLSNPPLITQMHVLKLFQQTLSSLQIIDISSIDAHPLNTLW